MTMTWPWSGGSDPPTPRRRFAKSVAVKSKDDENRIVTGLALRANELDKQGDFLDADGVRALHAEAPADGVLHSVFPTDHSALVRNEVLDEPETIDGVEFKAGDWVIQRQYTNAERWKLVQDGVLDGFSIGGEVTSVTEFGSVDDLPADVVIPDEVDPEAIPEKYLPLTKLTAGSVAEISDVDHPSVTSARHAAKADLAKTLVDALATPEVFVSLMQQRGASEEGATALFDYMQSVQDTTTDSDMDKSDLPDDATLGRRFKSLLFGDSGGRDSGTDVESFTHPTEKLTDEQAALAQEAIAEFVDAQGAEADVSTLREWLWNKDEDLDPDVRTALDAALEEFYDAQQPDSQAVGTVFAEWLTDEGVEKLRERVAKVEDLEEDVSRLTKRVDETETRAEAAEERAEKAEARAEKVGDLEARLDKLIEQGGARTQQVGKTNGEPDRSETVKLEQEVFTR